MAINSNFYVHDSDRIALDALKAIPGFTQVFKAIMKIWDEKQARIQNMSSYLRLGENQLSKYYNMLPPICKKLGIDVPELYLKLDVEANAYTWGDTKPYIVITSGLLETLPEELIPSVLAHECGHIACHHPLYTTIGHFILSEAVRYIDFDNITILPIQVAYSYWMRCSELSADRAATICDGTPDKVIETCMRLAGYDKDITEEANIDEFMNQALEYQSMINDSKWNKTLEFFMLRYVGHPFNSVRAYECNNWAKTEKFTKIVTYLNSANQEDADSLGNYLGEVPMEKPSKYYIGRNYKDVQDQLAACGFVDITAVKRTEKGLMTKNGQVIALSINKQEKFDKGSWYPVDSKVQIIYYEAETVEEVAAAHPGQLRTPDSSKRYLGRHYQDAVEDFINAGFTEIVTERQERTKKGLLSKEGSIAQISVNGQTQFSKGEWFEEKAVIRITFYSFSSDSTN